MSTIDTIDTIEAGTVRSRTGFSASSAGAIIIFWNWFGDAMMKHRTRIHLSELSNELLNDIGVAPAEARREIKRFFWD